MTRRRDRHGRGPRGPLVLPRAHGGVIGRVAPTRAEFFEDCVRQSTERVLRTCPGALNRVIIGIEDVPDAPDWAQGRVPLASAQDADGRRPARVVLYRRPLELRAASRPGLGILVHRTLVEQLSVLTGLPIDVIDPQEHDED
ncbi:metallopeptidase family protein [Acidipropionibacterium timonense]|uniref:metallopeptidase family protein n=1 Tax=Acidipropionibacterium timonense TaxID=2161818 RepID=UPI00102F70D0|nr:metallopeptidase family protein [Acidipropionibacterium timonense]